jgi:hypothetical protein
MYFFIKKILKDNLLSALSAWAFCFSPAFYYYMINPLPDVFALALGLHGLALTWKSNGPRLLFGLALLSLSALCKLPFGLFFLVPLVQQWSRPENGRQWAGLLAIGLFGLPPVIWYAAVVPDWAGNGIVQGLFKSRASVDELADYLLHNLVSTLPELLVNYAAMPFFLTGVYLAVRRNVPRKHPELLLLGLGLTAYFLFELNMIEKDHDYYLFPFYPLLFLAVGHGIRAFWGHANQKIRLVAVGLLALLPLTAGLRMQTRWQPERPGFNPDLLVHQRALQQAVPADALCIAGNDVSGYIFFYYIDKKGWAFQQDEPTGTQLSDWRNRGAGYLYSDSREIENRATAEGLLDTLVAEHGSVRVFKLKSPR